MRQEIPENKCHRMEKSDVINVKNLAGYLNTKWLAQDIIYEKGMDSTNTRAKCLGEAGAGNGMAVIAEYQTAGRGRQGRQWVSENGNCYFSMLLRPRIPTEGVAGITLVAALALAESIEKVSGLTTGIKWPNDVIINGRKVCGILTEGSSGPTYMNYVVVGIGVNCNQEEFPTEIRDVATSICLEMHRKVDRTVLLSEFFGCFERRYETFLETGDLQRLQEDYNKRLINRGREVKLLEKDGEQIRKAIGIDVHGGLLVEDEMGSRQTVIAGEVSVRGLYGYV